MRQDFKPSISRRKRCKSCNELFDPDRRTKGRQRYCSKSRCQSIRQRLNEKSWRERNPECVAYNQEQVRKWFKDHPGYSSQRRKIQPGVAIKNRNDTCLRLSNKRAKNMFDKSKSILTQLIGNSNDKCYLAHGGKGVYICLTKASPLSKRGSLIDNRKGFKRIANCLPQGRLYDLSAVLKKSCEYG